MRTVAEPVLNGLSGASADERWYINTTEELVSAAKHLSSARDLVGITSIVRASARRLTQSDGATFIMREGAECVYVDEDVTTPLWKGERFPINVCISGWVMLNAEPVVIGDVFNDPRISGDIYRRTFIKSMAMVPIRPQDPIGAIGIYWAHHFTPAREQIWALQSLADITSLAIQNIKLYALLQEKLQALEDSNRELSRFAWIISSELKDPLTALETGAVILERESGDMKPASIQQVRIMRQRVERMRKKLDDLLEYAQLERQMEDADNEEVSMSLLLQTTLSLLFMPPDFKVNLTGEGAGMNVQRMPLQQILFHLIENAVKHHDRQHGQIDIHIEDMRLAYRVSVMDDGPGLTPERQEWISSLLAQPDALPSRDSGMGLALVKKMLLGYGGSIQALSLGERGMNFEFTWPKPLSHMISKETQDVLA